jgi:hypothetical protein
MTTIDDCTLITLPKVTARSGNLTAVTGGDVVPFEIARVYYLYDVPGGESRGGHSHRRLEQILVCVMGALEIELDDGQRTKTVRLDRAYQGLYVPRYIWRRLVNFSSGCICVVLASLPYDEREYIRDYATFLGERGLRAA